MSAPRIVVVADVAAQPWKNGGGLTRELLAWPSHGDWTVRVSVADITRDGPFSAFAGVVRWFAVLEGEGVRLAFADGERVQRRGDAPLAFDGAAAPGCRLVDGPTRDLNLMLRSAGGARSANSGLVPAEAGRAWRPAGAPCGFFAAMAGMCRSDDGVAVELPACSLAWFEAAPQALHFEPAQDAPRPAASAARHAGAIGWWIAAPQPPGARA